MKFAACVLQGEDILIQEFIKEYNQVSMLDFLEMPISEASEKLAEYDFVDFVVPSRDVLYYEKTFPPVNRDKLMNIIEQDIETETSFSSEDVIIQPYTKNGKTVVMMIPREKLMSIVSAVGEVNREKIRSFIPEEMLHFIKSDKDDAAIFIGYDYTAFVSRSGQVIHKKGFSSIKKAAREIFGSSGSEEDFKEWLSSMENLTNEDNLSDDEIRLRKKFLNFCDELYERFSLFMKDHAEVSGVYLFSSFSDKFRALFPKSSWDVSESALFPSSELLNSVRLQGEDDNVNFARKEFAYKGGFSFIKKRIIATVLLCIASYIIMVISMQLKLTNLKKESDEITAKARKLAEDVIGRDMPSQRQALSIMKRTVNEGHIESGKKLYKYSALYLMEEIFPLIAFEDSSVDIKNINISNSGDVRLTGYSDTLEDINKATENIETHPHVTDMNKGQISSRRGRNSFSLNFKFVVEKQQENKKKN